MRFFLFFFGFGSVLVFVGFLLWVSYHLRPETEIFYPEPARTSWNFQSIDTMKYSRDLSREKLHDPAFEAVIERQTKAIAEVGATHIGIATPYDAEFLPMLRRWVEAARRHNLSIWFRGNWSGWEGWFEYPRISREEHLAKTQAFIGAHSDLFADGDVFSACPECENGGPGDPRRTGDVAGYRRFLVAEYQMMEQAFADIRKNVRTNFFSMNGDVARLIMDEATTRSLGGLVTIDHYVKTPEALAKDVQEIAEKSKGQVILGEWGYPIPDIHGSSTGAEQAQWMKKALELLEEVTALAGMNYWLAVGGSTEIWTATGTSREGAEVLSSFYKPKVVYGFVRDELGQTLSGATVHVGGTTTRTDQHGYFVLRYPSQAESQVLIEAPGFFPKEYPLDQNHQKVEAILPKQEKDWKFRILEFFQHQRDG